MLKAEETSLLNPVATSPGEPMSVDIKAEPDLKSEPEASSEWHSAPAGVDDTKLSVRKKSSSTSPPSEGGSSLTKSSPSPPPTPARATNSRKPPPSAPQLIGDLPVAREDALKTFNEIPCNNYQNKSLGRSKEMFESMTCDCVYEHGVDNEEDACGSYSDCINRLTQVECLSDDCRCRSYCQNQRFQKRQYANIEIVLTQLKGYGLRVEDHIPKDTFIYEYVGDVVSPASFKKRMRDYALEGIEHFYFMMLQKDEFIDATKSGGIGRFANHSCNPNCYVAKWTVGDYVRMGIFSKRDIQKHEELTFNYNVDRYGHQAQTCYCGEPNCVGFIGGKTQTDIVTMDDLYLDALGITDEDDVAILKGTKKKKGKKIEDLDFMPQIKPIVESEVPKVVQAIHQTQSKKVLMNLLTRIKLTEDQAALRQLMRLRGYSLMKNVLDEHTDDVPLIEMVLQCLKAWPLMNRNKVDDSVISTSVESLLNLPGSETVRTLAQELLDHWKSLPVYSRIPKRVYNQSEMTATYDQTSQIHDFAKEREEKAERKRKLELEELKRATIRHQERQKREKFEKEEELVQAKHKRVRLNGPKSGPPTRPSTPPALASKSPAQTKLVGLEAMQAHKESLKSIIAQAEAQVEEEKKAATAAAEARAKAEAEKAERVARRKAKSAAKKASSSTSAQDQAANKEKRLLKLVGAVVVKCMSKYAKNLPRELFKKYAKELTQIIADKEKKSASHKEDRLETLSDEKVAKIKKFSKDYIAKVLRKLEKGGKHPRPSVSLTPTNATASSSRHTPNSVDGQEGDVSMAADGPEMSMSVEEAMDMDPDSGSDDDAEGEDDDGDGEDITAEQAETGITPLLHGLTQSHSSLQVDEPMVFSRRDEISEPGWESTDPRRRVDFSMDIHG